jgi:hypothetical protein
LAESLAYPGGEERVNFLIQLISTCLPSLIEEGGRGSAPLWSLSYLILLLSHVENPPSSTLSLIILAMVREESPSGGGQAGGGSGGDADAAEHYESCHNGSVPVGLNSSSGAQEKP